MKTIKTPLIFIAIILFLQFFVSGFNIKDNGFAIKSSAEAMIVVDAESGRVFDCKNENKRLPMASTTKILTAIVAIENCDDLNKKHKIPKQAVGVEGSSIYLKEGEELTVKELLYGLMLRSGNDSAVALAVIISGTVEKFVKLMNAYCDRLELSNTHIVTVNGLHDDNHYTTARELSIITAYALKNKIFAEIVSTKEKTISNDLGKDKHRYLRNKNRYLNLSEYADGVKTGYTKKAGRCFVGSATKNGLKVVCVLLNCAPMFEECEKLIDEVFAKYSKIKLFEKGEILKIYNEDLKQNIPVILKEDVILPLSKDEISKVTAKLKIKSDLSLKNDENEPIGLIELSLENNLIFSQKIYTIIIEKNATVKDNFHKIIKAFWYGKLWE